MEKTTCGCAEGCPSPRPTEEDSAGGCGLEVGFDAVAVATGQLRIGGAVLEDEVLEVDAVVVRLRLVEVFLLGYLILRSHLEVLIGGLRHTEIHHLV